MAVGSGAFVWSVSRLGGLPLFELFRGSATIAQVNENLASAQPPLLLGLLLAVSLSLGVTSALLLLTGDQRTETVKAGRKLRLGARSLAALGLTLAVLFSLYQGKRQGALQVAIGFLAMASYRMESFWPRVTGPWLRGDRDSSSFASRRRLQDAILLFGFVPLVAVAFNYLGQLRTGFPRSVSTLDFVRLYALGPTLQLGYLARAVPPSAHLRGQFLFLSLAPAKLASALLGQHAATTRSYLLALDRQSPLPTVPATFLGRLFIDYGEVGALLGAFLIGAVAMWAYRRRSRGLLHAVTYAVIAPALVTVFSDNWFYTSSLVYLPLIGSLWLARSGSARADS